jgi:hypothetical protein
LQPIGCRAGYAPFSINLLLGFNVLDNLERIAATSTNASKEYSLEKAMEKMKSDWAGMEFRVIEYKDTGTYIVGGTDEVQVRIGWLHIHPETPISKHALLPRSAEGDCMSPVVAFVCLWGNPLQHCQRPALALLLP